MSVLSAFMAKGRSIYGRSNHVLVGCLVNVLMRVCHNLCFSAESNRKTVDSYIFFFCVIIAFTITNNAFPWHDKVTNVINFFVSLSTSAI